MSARGHIPVLLDEAVAALAPRAEGTYLDATFGGGGYASAILEAVPCTLWALDRDPAAIARGAALAARFPGRLHLVETRFGAMLEALAERGVTTLDGVVMDLGVSSFQLDEGERGFSFRAEGPLDMRMGRDGPSAAELVNGLDAESLAKILSELGEERHARKIARAILRERSVAPITTTGRLASIVRSSIPRDPSGLDSATRSFQALRMAVNEELPEIEQGLAAAAALLSPGGRLVVVSFHSLEDRIVKRFFAARTGREGLPSRHDPAALLAPPKPEFSLLTSRAVRPGAAELAMNPRARSARLRAMERLPCSDR
ncbi:16S rRNA (cytosine(1402)-N(4))-methyltransferase RsmH [Plastoroseomonas arctica]|uniref:Ribosomal RNA small subunit methyltransferase H n=1 Tax=Plastoroseomonas arctica TaxID=1509237 RepID=A0AAF1KPB7_9PROT|nr:16S rRNA (cytosine(1402)-N(4))-methyltransferase RsmH [Plastoroseomonas arctica]MBR0655693.1 16S rRNA (cytosine(1402)-N(4))-methyltransferase RsmH [Plastoroseomonas arctica]